MAKFKVGDRVRYVNPDTMCLNVGYGGARGTIASVDEETYYFEEGSLSIRVGDQVGGEFELELVPERTPVQMKPEIVVGVYRYFNVTKVEGGKVGITAHATLGPDDLESMARQFMQMAEVLRNS